MLPRAVAAHLYQPEALTDQVIKRLLILRRSQPVPSDPSWALALFPDRGVGILRAQAVAAHLYQPEALTDQVIKRLLILRRSQPVPSGPSWTLALFPDRGVRIWGGVVGVVAGRKHNGWVLVCMWYTLIFRCAPRPCKV